MNALSLKVVSGHKASPLCVGCGACCKQLPGTYLPEDFQELTVEFLVHQMVDRKLAVDYIEEENPRYFLRPPTTTPRYKDSPQDPSWGGTCVFLRENGCELTFEQRPSQCRHLEARPNKKCKADSGYTKKQCANAWKPYRRMILEAVEKAEKLMGRED
jgi:Fe-S-cluster containining protein